MKKSSCPPTTQSLTESGAYKGTRCCPKGHDPTVIKTNVRCKGDGNCVTATATTATPASRSTSTWLIVGVGVGVSLALMFLLCAAVGWRRRRRLGRHNKELKENLIQVEGEVRKQGMQLLLPPTARLFPR